MTTAKATFEIKSWEEKTYDEANGRPKLTRASVKKTFHGDLNGESNVEYLMSYAKDGSASFVGLERFVGSVGGRSGSFVFQHDGTFINGVAKDRYVVVPNSATEDLVGIRGQGEMSMGHAQNYPMQFEYSFE